LVDRSSWNLPDAGTEQGVQVLLGDRATRKPVEMDVEMTTLAEMTFKCISRSSKVAPIES